MRAPQEREGNGKVTVPRKIEASAAERKAALQQLFPAQGYCEELQQAINVNDEARIKTVIKKQFAQIHEPSGQATFLRGYGQFFPDLAAGDTWYHERIALIPILESPPPQAPKPPTEVEGRGGWMAPAAEGLSPRKDVTFWRKRRENFDALHKEEAAPNPTNFMDTWLRVYLDEDDNQWSLQLNAGISEGFKARFEEEATEAGKALGVSPSISPLEAWLRYLFQDARERKSKYLKGGSEKGGIITPVCLASATYCSRLVNEALESTPLSEMLPAPDSGSPEPRQNTDQAETPIVGVARPAIPESTGTGGFGAASSAGTGESGIRDRRAAIDTYIDEVFHKTGKRITRTDIWKAARYKSRSEFERWERKDPKRRNSAADERFTRILNEKPHLK